MTADDWSAVRRIYAEGIATGDATLSAKPPTGATSTIRTRSSAGRGP